jgi:hypothetical protein
MKDMPEESNEASTSKDDETVTDYLIRKFGHKKDSKAAGSKTVSTVKRKKKSVRKNRKYEGSFIGEIFSDIGLGVMFLASLFTND